MKGTCTCFIHGLSLLTNRNFSGLSSRGDRKLRDVAIALICLYMYGIVPRMYLHGKKMAAPMVKHGNIPRMYLYRKEMAASMVITPLNTPNPIILYLHWLYLSLLWDNNAQWLHRKIHRTINLQPCQKFTHVGCFRVLTESPCSIFWGLVYFIIGFGVLWGHPGTFPAHLSLFTTQELLAAWCNTIVSCWLCWLNTH